ncbi:MAG: ABC transporter ATP-binding protein [Candidatus Cyclobacteriaceae bacterium M2_1C_046]
MKPPSIKITNLSYHYPKQEEPVLTNINLSVEQGESFGLFGPNGAGKTTLMSLITNVLSYQTGKIEILGNDVKNADKEVKRLFGLVPQQLSFYQQLSPIANLEFYGAWAGLKKKEIQERSFRLFDILGLTKVKDKPVKNLSGGMKRRVNLAIGVIQEPKILFLDEPTVGVDVQSRHAMLDYLKELNQKGTTLFYTSHHLSEAQELCNRVALIDNGEILVHDFLPNLLHDHKEGGLESLFLKLTGKAFRD